MGHPDSELQVRYVSWAEWIAVWYFERGVWVWVRGGEVLDSWLGKRERLLSCYGKLINHMQQP